MLKKQETEKAKVDVKEEEEEELPLDYASDKLFFILSVIPMIGWMVGVSRWNYFGVSIKEMNLTISPQEIGFIAFIMSIVLTGIGVLTTWKEPTLSNLGVNVAFPIVFVCAIFTAEKNFLLTGIIMTFSFFCPLFWGIRKYLTWKDRKYLTSERRCFERFKIYIVVRKKVLLFLTIGVVPWTLWNWFSGPKYDFVRPQYSEDMDFSYVADKSKYPLLEGLDEMWSDSSSEERLSAVNELVAYECESLGVGIVPVEIGKRKIESQEIPYDSKHNRIVFNMTQLEGETFSYVISRVIRSCRYKYQLELVDCVKELQKMGEDVKGMPDFSEACQYAEEEEQYEKGEISRREFMDRMGKDAIQWQKEEMKNLIQEFHWNID